MPHSSAVLVAVMMQDKRRSIVLLLRQSKEPLWIDQIAKKIGVPHRLTSFHLATLEMHGLVKSEWGEIQKATPRSTGRAGRFFQLTPLAEKTLKSLQEELAQSG